MELKKYKLGEIADIIGGVTYTPSDVCTQGVRILRGGNILSQNIELKDNDVFLPEVYKSSANQVQYGDTIVVASTGSAEVLGKTATCFCEMPNTQIGAFLRIVRPKELKYAMIISVALTSKYFSEYIRNQSKGTSINNINSNHLKDFDIYIASHNSIEVISAVYQNIQNKIDINRAINQNLRASRVQSQT